MRKNIIAVFSIALTATILLLQNSCMKDSCKNRYTHTYYTPIYKPLAEVKANIKSNPSREIKSPGKIYIKGNYIFLNEVNKGIHVIDNSDPRSPKNMSFIDIPGNVDIAIKGNTLYADFYTLLVVMDVSDPLNIKVDRYVDKVFQPRDYGTYPTDSTQVIVDWEEKQETIVTDCGTNSRRDSAALACMSCGFSGPAMLSTSSSGAASTIGISGSLSRFALVNNYFYAVGTNQIKVIDISTLQNPVFVRNVGFGNGLETLFPFNNKLFVGSVAGMFIYNLNDPANPAYEGGFAHMTACDPVIADGNTAYVTLRSGARCSGASNQLDVLDITNMQQVQLLRTYPMVSPRGLSKSGQYLFICDGDGGFKMFDAASPTNITLLKNMPMKSANDVITFGNTALVIAGDGLYQFDYSNPADVKQLSKINIQK